MVKRVENLTIKELLTEYYIQKGYPVGPSTSKYSSFILPSAGNKVFLGKSGAIRIGASISSSLSYTDHYRKEEVLEAVREVVRKGRELLKAHK